MGEWYFTLSKQILLVGECYVTTLQAKTSGGESAISPHRMHQHTSNIIFQKICLSRSSFELRCAPLSLGVAAACWWARRAAQQHGDCETLRPPRIQAELHIVRMFDDMNLAGHILVG